MNKFEVIYNYVEALSSASEHEIELFKHFLCEQLSELDLTDSQLEYLEDKSDTIEIDFEIQSI
jgi:hypothetical protein